MANPYQNQMNHYKRMKIETASPEMLILMLYDGAIKNIVSAQGAIDSKIDNWIEISNNGFIKAQNIITELMVSLNFEIGGEIAKNLFNIYEFINYTLAQANVSKETGQLETIVTMLKDLRTTWQEVIRINREKYPNGIPALETENLQGNSHPAGVAENPLPTSPPLQPASVSPSVQENRFNKIYGKTIPRKI